MQARHVETIEPVSILVEATGWFGVPGREGGLVHAVAGRVPICGTKFHRASEFQWCAHGVLWDYLECAKCKKMITWRRHWTKVSPVLWRRSDGAFAEYNQSLMGPETDINNFGHRGWVAFDPSGAYLGFFPRRRRRGGYSKMRVPIKFKTHSGAVLALQKAFPCPKT